MDEQTQWPRPRGCPWDLNTWTWPSLWTSFCFSITTMKKQENNIYSADFIQRLFMIKWDKMCIGALKGTTCPKMYIPSHLSSELGAGVGDGRVAAVAAAKSLQLCLTLCDPIDSSLPGSSVHGSFRAKVLECGAIAFWEGGGSSICYFYLNGLPTSQTNPVWTSTNFYLLQLSLFCKWIHHLIRCLSQKPVSFLGFFLYLLLPH